MKTFLQSAIEYAGRRWCWDDESFIEEQFAHIPPRVDETPEQWIDALAEEYDLIDPDEEIAGEWSDERTEIRNHVQRPE